MELAWITSRWILLRHSSQTEIDCLSTSRVDPDEVESSLLYAIEGAYCWTHSFKMVKKASHTDLTASSRESLQHSM